MIARRLSRVAARTASVETAPEDSEGAAARSASLAPSLASTAGHRPSMAESQSGRGLGAAFGVQAGSAAARATSPALSCREAKKARQDGSTEFGSADHLA